MSRRLSSLFSRRLWRSPRGARYGQTAVFGVLALVFVGALASAAAVVESALRTVASGEGERLLHALRPVIDGPGDVAGRLAQVVDRRRDEGLRCVALFNPQGAVEQRVGDCWASDAAMQSILQRARPGEVMPAGPHLAFVHRLPPPRPPGPPPWGGRGAGRDPDLPPPAGAPPPFGAPPLDAPPADAPPFAAGRAAPPPGLPPPFADPGAQPFLIEFVAVQADALRRAAMGSVAAGFAAAAALMVATVVFWRLSSRAELLQRAVERDRRLAAVGEMSAVLAHEIRNPLASLKGHAQLLLETLAAGTRARRDAEWVVRESVRLEALCEDLLSLVRSSQISRQDVDPAALLREAAQGLDPERIVLDVSQAPPRWALDPVRMHQVLDNLLRNGLQASAAGAPVAAAVRSERGALVFAIRDHGPGIAAEDTERIFEAFHTTKTRGTGLGLAVARRIVEQHGGTIVVHNHPQGGADFRVHLPWVAHA